MFLLHKESLAIFQGQYQNVPDVLYNIFSFSCGRALIAEEIRAAKVKSNENRHGRRGDLLCLCQHVQAYSTTVLS